MNYKPNVLVVDDTPANLDLLESILTGHDYEVRKIPNGPLALISAQAAAPDLILLDVKMPVMDGYEVCARLKAEPATRDIPVIFISALQETQDKVRAFTAGGVDYITKPFQTEEVLARVATHLGLYRLQREMAQARAEAEAANRAKSAFLANMSHELRTPLNAVLGFAQVLEHDSRLLDDQLGHVAAIGRGGRYLLTLINDVLDLAKVEAGRFELVPTDWGPEAFFEDLIAMFRVRTEQKGLELRFIASSNPLPKVLHSDEKRLRQVLMNLLGNAVKFTPSGAVTLRISFDADQLIVEVEDEGIGIAADDLSRIFEPFKQAGENSYKAQGTGLGLAISHKLVELMQGRIEVTSEPGQGARFTLSIPVGVIASDAQEQPAATDAAPVTGYTRTTGEGPLRVLINDPDRDNRDFLHHWLAPLGFETRRTSTADECLEAALSWRPDLVLTEIRLKEMDGLELVRRLRADPVRLEAPIVALTASAFKEDRVAALSGGSNAILTKPLTLVELLDALGRELPLSWQHAVDVPLPEDSGALSLDQWQWLQTRIKAGNMRAIETYLDELMLISPAAGKARKLLAMARRFDIQGLRTEIEKGLREP